MTLHMECHLAVHAVAKDRLKHTLNPPALIKDFAFGTLIVKFVLKYLFSG